MCWWWTTRRKPRWRIRIAKNAPMNGGMAALEGYATLFGDHLAQGGFQLRHAAGQIFDRLAFRVRQAAMLQGAIFGAYPHHAAGDADHRAIVGHRVHHHRPRTHLHVIADSNVAQHFRARAHHHVVADGGMALALLVAGTAQGHALVEQHVVANLRGLADHHAGTVVDEEAASDGGAGMNLDPGKEAADLRDHARHQRHAPAVQAVRQAVHQDGVEARVAEKNLQPTLGGRVLPEDGVDPVSYTHLTLPTNREV